MKKIVVHNTRGFHVKDLQFMLTGAHIFKDGREYGICGECLKVIRWDKPIFGSFHFCIKDENDG